MARSGGTLISKCLGCMQDIAMLSEIHPLTFAEPFNPLTQAIKYHNLLSDKDIEALKARGTINWEQAIRLIARRAKGQNKHLLIRDWSHLDFTGTPWIDNPSYQLNTANVLKQYFDLKQITTVRHPIDQWLSLEKLGLINGKINIPTFLKGYLAFAEHAKTIGFVRFEDFTNEPNKYAKILCQALDIPFDAEFINKWSSYTNITGDVSSNGPGRATLSNKIRPLKRRDPSSELLQTFKRCPHFEPAIKLLNYSI